MSTTMLAYEVGMNAFANRDYPTAIERFREVLAVDPGNTGVREHLARAHYHRAQLTLAETEVRRLLEADPTDEYALLLLARTLERQGRADEAAPVRRLLAATTGDPTHAKAHEAWAA